MLPQTVTSESHEEEFYKEDKCYKRRGDWVAKIYPSGDFTIGKRQPVRNDKNYKPLDGLDTYVDSGGAVRYLAEARQSRVFSDSEKLERISIDFQKAGQMGLADFFGDRYAKEILSGNQEIITDSSGYEENFISSSENTSLMGLSVATNSHRDSKNNKKSSKKSQRRGMGGITSYGKRITRSGVAMLEDYYGRDCLSFGTATLPFLSYEELKRVCENWGVIANRFFFGLTRLLESRGLSKDYVFVTEIQEERYEKFGQVCPHLHWIMQGKKTRRQFWLVLPSEIRELWERILGNFLGRVIDGSTATRIEKPVKSLRKEMGKYLSKGAKIINRLKEDGKENYLPSAYHGSSRLFKRKIKEAIKVLSGQDCDDFIDSLFRASSKDLLSFRPIQWEIPNAGGKKITIGFVGFVKKIELIYQLIAA